MLKKYYKNKKILITGGSGFIGLNLTRELNKLGCKITSLYFKNKPSKMIKGIKYIKADLLIRKNCLKVCKKQDYVFMCAANSSGAAIMENKPLDHLTPNIIMNALILESSYIQSVKKICFISSSTVYPNSKAILKEKSVNFDLFEKYFIVGWMKLFSEIMCKMYSEKIKKPMKSLIVRPSNLYGPHDKFDEVLSKVIPSLIKKSLKAKNSLEVWGDGKDVKDFIYIDDFIKALILSFSYDDISTANISYGKSVSIKKIIKIILKYTQPNIQVKHNLKMPQMIPFRKISNEYIKKKIKWEPQVDIYTGLKRTIDWYKNNIFAKE